MTVLRSVLLFVLAAVAEIGGAWLVWQGVRELRGLLWIGAGVLALLGAARTIPSLITQQDSTMAFRGTAGVICLILLVAVVKCLKAERDRRSIEQLKSSGE